MGTGRPGSDRPAEVWCKKYAIEDAEGLQLQHFCRAMAWLGEALPSDQQGGATPFALRCVKDRLEEMLFAQTRCVGRPHPSAQRRFCLRAAVTSTDAWKRHELGSSEWGRRLRDPEPTSAGNLIYHPSWMASLYPFDPCGREFLNEYQENSRFPLIFSIFARVPRFGNGRPKSVPLPDCMPELP